MATYGTYNLEIPDGTDRANTPVAFSEFTDTLDPVLDDVVNQSTAAADSVIEVASNLGALQATVNAQGTSINNLNTKTTELAKEGVMLVVRHTVNTEITPDSTYVTLPFNATPEYRHPSGAWASFAWTAPAAGRVRVSGAACCGYGPSASSPNEVGSNTLLTALKGSTRYRLAQFSVLHNVVIASGSTTFTVVAGDKISLQVYMNNYETTTKRWLIGPVDNANYMMIEYLQLATP